MTKGWKLNKTTILTVALGVGSLGTLSLAVPAMAGGDDQVDIDDVVPAFAAEQTAEDALPKQIEVEGLGSIRPDTIRKVTSDDRASYWVTRSGTSDLCVITRLPGGYELAASSCGPATQAYRHGIGIALQEGDDPLRSVEAYLLPDDVDARAFRQEVPELTVEDFDGATLAILHPQATQPASATELRPHQSERANGADSVFISLALEGRE